MRVTRPCLVIGVVLVDAVLLWVLPGPWNYYWLFAVGCWVVVNLYWAWAGRKAVPMLGRWSWAIWLLSVGEFMICCLPLSSVPILGQRSVPRFPVVEIVAAGMSALGTGLAIWARHILAKNWNNVPSLRDNHALVQQGPYAIIRHPIYAGFIMSAVGMILVLGEIRGLVLLIDIVVFFRRLKPEETILGSTYPSEYPAYERRTKRLIPFIW